MQCEVLYHTFHNCSESLSGTTKGYEEQICEDKIVECSLCRYLLELMDVPSSIITL